MTPSSSSTRIVGEGLTFDDAELNAMLALAKGGIRILNDLQAKACELAAETLD